MSAETQNLATPRPAGAFWDAEQPSREQCPECYWNRWRWELCRYHEGRADAKAELYRAHVALVAACEAALDAVIDEQDDFGEATTATLVVKLQHALRLARGGAE